MTATTDRIERRTQAHWLIKAKQDAEALYDTLLDLQYHTDQVFVIEDNALGLARINLLGLGDVLNAIKPKV